MRLNRFPSQSMSKVLWISLSLMIFLSIFFLEVLISISSDHLGDLYAHELVWFLIFLLEIARLSFYRQLAAGLSGGG
jgi:hypothetical protein